MNHCIVEDHLQVLHVREDRDLDEVFDQVHDWQYYLNNRTRKCIELVGYEKENK